MPCNYKKYPKDWFTRIRPDILKRADNRCEHCGVDNYAVGYRKASGAFVCTGGNIYHMQAGNGELSYKDAKALCEHINEYEEGYKHIVIVLTIAHLDNNTSNNDYNNLRALCQKCHNNLDVEYRKDNRKKTIDAKKGFSLFSP